MRKNPEIVSASLASPDETNMYIRNLRSKLTALRELAAEWRDGSRTLDTAYGVSPEAAAAAELFAILDTRRGGAS